jgi:hypothetical protein
MKFNIINVSTGSFTDDETKKEISFGSVHVLNEEKQTTEGNYGNFSGLEVKKIKCNPELYSHIKSQVPDYFECQVDFIGKDNKLKIVSAVKVK